MSADDAIVEDAAVDRPRPRPGRERPGIVRIGVVAAGHVVARLVERAGIDPAAAGRGAVVAQGGEADDLLALLQDRLGRVVRIGDVGHDVAVDLLGDLVRFRIARILVGPHQLRQRIRIGAAFLLVERFETQIELRHDPGVVLGFAGRRAAGPMPLQPAAGIGQRTLVLGKAGGRQLDHLGLDRGRVHVVVVAVVLPEPRRLGLQRIHDDEEFELRQRRVIFLRFGNDSSGLKPWQT